MGVAFVGRGLGFVGSPTGTLTPADYIAETWRILAETGFSLITETSQYLRTEQDG